MHIINVTLDTATIQFIKDEARVLGNTLNEVLNAFSWDFSHTGRTKEEAHKLHKYIVVTYNNNRSDKFIFTLAKRDVLFLIAAIDETIRKLARSYSTRLGYTVEEARQLQADLNAALQQMQQA